MTEFCDLSTEDFEALREIEELTGIVVKRWRWPAFKAEIERLERDKCLGRSSLETRSRLIDVVSIAESYFFRHQGHFDLLASFARERAAQGLPCRVLCAGSSTGEETWSAAAVLAAVSPPNGQQHQVEGWELSRNRIEHARRGQYNTWSCRRGFSGYDEYFEKTETGYRVGEALRSMVSFSEVNLKKGLLPNDRSFDVVFFRNVSIYFDEETTRDICRNLADLIAEGGRFFVGPSDPILMPAGQWQQHINGSARQFLRLSPITSADAHRHKVKISISSPISTPLNPSKSPSAKSSVRASKRSPDRVGEISTKRSKVNIVQNRVAPCEATASVMDEQPNLIDRVQHLADTGRYKEALDVLQDANVEPSSLTRRWNGILRLNTGEFDLAVRAFRQCVFLSPDDPDLRGWLAVAYDCKGMKKEAEREFRNAGEL